MNHRRSILLIALILVCGLGALLLIPSLTRAQDGGPIAGVVAEIAAPDQNGAPSVVSYQGQVTVGGAPISGSGKFKFAIVNQVGDRSYWSNDGTSTGGGEPNQGVPLPVTNGLFMVLLGDTSLTNMTQPLGAAVFEGTDRYLRVWFSSDGSSYERLNTDQRIAAVPYALQAERVQGYAGVVVVAKSGGDYTAIQPAVDSISNADEENPYLVWVAPGVYEGAVTLKPYIHLQGAGQETTIISSTVSSASEPPTAATVVLADETSLRDVSVKNYGSGAYNVGVLLGQDEHDARMTDVSIETRGEGSGKAYGIYARGRWSDLVCLELRTQVSSSGESYGLYNDTSNTQLYGGQFSARFGDKAYGIYNEGSELLAEGVNLTARNAGDNFGLYNRGWQVRWQGGMIDVKGGGDTWGIYNTGSDNRIFIFNVDVYSEGSLLVVSPSDYVTGLENTGGATAVLSGGRYRAYGGVEQTRGIYNYGAGSILEANSITAEGGADPSYNLVYGLFNDNAATAVLYGGAYLAEGGDRSRGILNRGLNTSLEATGISAQGRDSGTQDLGLFNQNTGASADVNNSTLVGDDALYQAGGTVRILASQLDGGIYCPVNGTLICRYTVDQFYSSEDCTCP
jgi:hypothetical protein